MSDAAQYRVSVAMATYNGARFLREQLSSLASQTLRPIELVACDDGSTDETVAILEQFAREAPFPVRIERNQQRLHYGSNFLNAASLCTGRFVAFCDQDDVWHETKLEASVNALCRHGAILCTHPYIPVDARGEPLPHDATSERRTLLTGRDMEPWDVFYGFTCTVDRRLLELIPWRARPIDLIDETKQVAHDRWIYFLAASTGRTVIVPEALAFYRQHGANTYGDRKIGWRHKLNRVRTKYPRYLEKRRTISHSHVSLLTGVDAASAEMAPYIQDAVARWQSLCAEYESRSAVFRERTAVKRLLRYGQCLVGGTYGRRIGGSRMRTAAEDLVAVFLAAS